MKMLRLSLVCLFVAAAAAGIRADVIDRILATVGGALILQSDAVAAVRLGFLRIPQGQENPLQWTLDRLVERRLMLTEVERFGPPEPKLEEIDAAMRGIDERIGSGEQLAGILAEAGLSVGQLRLWVRDELRLAAYLRQRFGTPVEPSEEEIVRYYREHEQEFTAAGKLLQFAQAREQARAAVMQQRRESAIREWLASLRRRIDVNIIYLSR